MFEEKSQPFWDNGLKFSCVSCGRCCRHDPGYVFLSQEDLYRLAAFKQISAGAFLKGYCRMVDLGAKKFFSLQEKENYDCIFWDKGCTVYKARPGQCRRYPFWPSLLTSSSQWEKEKEVCPGIGQGKIKTNVEIKKYLKAKEEEVLLEPTQLWKRLTAEAL